MGKKSKNDKTKPISNHAPTSASRRLHWLWVVCGVILLLAVGFGVGRMSYPPPQPKLVEGETKVSAPQPPQLPERIRYCQAPFVENELPSGDMYYAARYGARKTIDGSFRAIWQAGELGIPNDCDDRVAQGKDGLRYEALRYRCLATQLISVDTGTGREVEALDAVRSAMPHYARAVWVLAGVRACMIFPQNRLIRDMYPVGFRRVVDDCEAAVKRVEMPTPAWGFDVYTRISIEGQPEISSQLEKYVLHHARGDRVLGDILETFFATVCRLHTELVNQAKAFEKRGRKTPTFPPPKNIGLSDTM